MEKLIKIGLFLTVLVGSAVALAPLANATEDQGKSRICTTYCTPPPIVNCTTICY